MISIIIPVYNEEKTIGRVIDRIKGQLNCAYEIIVVNNCSTDRSLQRALARGVRVIEQKKKGKGLAMKLGADSSEGDVLVFIDGDDTYSAGHIPDLVKPLADGSTDMVYGSRFGNLPLKMSFMRRTGNKIFNFLGSVLFSPVTDLLSGMVAVRKEVFFQLNPRSTGFEIEAELFGKGCRAGMRRRELNVSYRERRGSKLRPLPDGFRILMTLLKVRVCG